MSLADKPFQLSEDLCKQIKFISPNIHELRKIAELFGAADDSVVTSSSTSSPSTSDNRKLTKLENVCTYDDRTTIFQEIADLCRVMENRIDNIIVTAGHLGVFVCRSSDAQDPFFTNDLSYMRPNSGKMALRHYSGTRIDNVVNASGAGDALCSGFIAGMLRNKCESICVSIGLAAALKTLNSKNAVPDEFFDAENACWNSAASFKRIV